MRRVLLCTAIAACIGVATFIYERPTPPPPRPRPVATTHPAEWELNAADQQRIRAGLRRIELRDSKDHVIGMLGTPDKDQVSRPKLSDQPPHGSSILYYFRRYRNGFVNEKWDQYVFLIFDTDDRLVEIKSKVDDIPSRR